MGREESEASAAAVAAAAEEEELSDIKFEQKVVITNKSATKTRLVSGWHLLLFYLS